MVGTGMVRERGGKKENKTEEMEKKKRMGGKAKNGSKRLDKEIEKMRKGVTGRRR